MKVINPSASAVGQAAPVLPDDQGEPCVRPSVPVPDLAALQASAAKACALLKVMAHADRLVLLCRLAQGEFCVSELETDLGIRQPTLSQQLAVLRQEGLVDTRREGKHVYYRLASEDAAAVMAVLHSRMCGAQD